MVGIHINFVIFVRGPDKSFLALVLQFFHGWLWNNLYGEGKESCEKEYEEDQIALTYLFVLLASPSKWYLRSVIPSSAFFFCLLVAYFPSRWLDLVLRPQRVELHFMLLLGLLNIHLDMRMGLGSKWSNLVQIFEIPLRISQLPESHNFKTHSCKSHKSFGFSTTRNPGLIRSSSIFDFKIHI
jgi:hypothetical protein